MSPAVVTLHHAAQVISLEEAETLRQERQLLLSETACGHAYGITRAAVQAVQFQDKVSSKGLIEQHRQQSVYGLAIRQAINWQPSLTCTKEQSHDNRHRD